MPGHSKAPGPRFMRKKEMRETIDRLKSERAQLERDLVDVTQERDRLKQAANKLRRRKPGEGDPPKGRFRPKTTDGPPLPRVGEDN